MAQTLEILALGALCLAVSACAATDAPPPACEAVSYGGAPYVVCAAKPGKDDIRLFHSGPDGAPFGDFDVLRAHLDDIGETLVFAMNGGMYHPDRSPVGLYIDPDGQRASLNTNEGPGNFHMLPNGVFVMDEAGVRVLETTAYAAAYQRPGAAAPVYASQSGPMLVIEGEIHPSLNPDGTSRKRRNGVGVSEDGETVYFVISDVPVTFHDFASVFRDRLGTPNALYLDGVVSRLFAAELGRDENGLDMGPMVGVVE